MGRRNKGRGSTKKKRGGKSKQSTLIRNNEEGAYEEEHPDELRFNVGDRVDCNMRDNTCLSGTVTMRNWEDDMGDIFPYRIRLDNGSITYAPVDMDDCIKRSSTLAVDVNAFKVGSRVECLRNGTWSIGTVTNRHPNWLDDDPVGSAPYNIRFDSQPGISEFFLGPANGIKSSKVEQMMDELRFNVGDRVECSVGGDRQNVRRWLPGTIVKQWYSDVSFEDNFLAPYQIRLDIGRLIYAPADEDITIRKFDSPAPSCWICYDDEQTEDNPIVRECACRGEENGYVHIDCLAKLAISKAGNKYQEGIDDENPFDRCITCKQEFRTNSESFSALAKQCMADFGDEIGSPWYGTATSMFIRLMIMESRSYEEDSKRYDFAEKMLLNRCDIIIEGINLGGPNTDHFFMLELSKLYDVLAIVYEEKMELDKMKETLEKSLRLIVSLENGTPSRRKIKILSSLAKHACLVGDTSVAVKHYEKCISIMRGQAKENDILLATLLLKSGNLELELGNTERGIEQISESVDTMTTVYGCDDELVSKVGSSFDKVCEGDLRSIPKALLVRVDFPRAPLYSSRSF